MFVIWFKQSGTNTWEQHTKEYNSENDAQQDAKVLTDLGIEVRILSKGKDPNYE